MKVGQDYVSLWFQTETLGYKPTGFRVIIAAIPAVTWRKDKKYVVSIVSPWPSSSGLGEIAFFPTPWPLRLRLPSVQAQASNLCPPPPPRLPMWASTQMKQDLLPYAGHLQSPGFQVGLFIFKMIAGIHWAFIVSLLFVHSIPLMLFAIQWGRSSSIPIFKRRDQKLKDLPAGDWAGPMPGEPDNEWQQYLCPHVSSIFCKKYLFIIWL